MVLSSNEEPGEISSQIVCTKFSFQYQFLWNGLHLNHWSVLDYCTRPYCLQTCPQILARNRFHAKISCVVLWSLAVRESLKCEDQPMSAMWVMPMLARITQVWRGAKVKRLANDCYVDHANFYSLSKTGFELFEAKTLKMWSCWLGKHSHRVFTKTVGLQCI